MILWLEMLQNDLIRPCCCPHGDLMGQMPSKRLDTFQPTMTAFPGTKSILLFFLFLTFIFPVWAIAWKLKSSLIYTGESWSSAIDCSVYTWPTRISGARLSLLPAGFGWTRPSGLRTWKWISSMLYRFPTFPVFFLFDCVTGFYASLCLWWQHRLRQDIEESKIWNLQTS